MGALDTLEAHLDAALEQLVGSDLYRSEIMQASKDYRDGGTYTETWTRLQNLAAQIFETAALLADDDITELTATIANEKDVKMAEYKLPAEPDGPVWDKNGDKWVRVKENLWYGGFHVYWGWGDVVHYYGPLTTPPPTPPIKVGDTGLTAEQVWDLPEGTVIWPELAEDPEPWMRYGDRWESISEFAGDAGELQYACGDGFTVLRLGGGE